MKTAAKIGAVLAAAVVILVASIAIGSVSLSPGQVVEILLSRLPGGADYEGDTLSYLRALAGINRALAARADRVAEVVCGLPNWLKGGPA